jgi:hypothetical protein
MRYAFLVIALVLSGCSTLPEAPSKTILRKDSVIYVGMLFSDADSRLREYGAKPTMFQMVLTRKAYKRGNELHYYRLHSGVILDMVSQPGKTGRIVGSMSVSTYDPKSWDSKLDPERDEFFGSFQSREEYDLEGGPNKPPEATPVKSPPSNQ